MTPQGRKIFNLSMAIIALSLVHFFLAYSLITTGGFSVAAGIFVVLGVGQAGLGVYGVFVAWRKH